MRLWVWFLRLIAGRRRPERLLSPAEIRKLEIEDGLIGTSTTGQELLPFEAGDPQSSGWTIQRARMAETSPALAAQGWEQFDNYHEYADAIKDPPLRGAVQDIWSVMTREEVMRLQAKAGITVDGIPGPLTRAQVEAEEMAIQEGNW